VRANATWGGRVGAPLPVRLANTVFNALRPGYARVMAGKALGRVRRDGRHVGEAVAWARPRSIPIPEYCRTLDADLWTEAEEFGHELRAYADELGTRLGVKLGGGARAELLYFLTRHKRPRTVLETGVLHGYSSASFLHALARNRDDGRLFSSDFPYFRARDPEAMVGVLVPDDLRDVWTLLLEGDRKNLPALLARSGPVDLFHYDSDKTYAGRRRALQLVTPHLAPHAFVVMDDIQDNLFFRDWASGRTEEPVILGTGSFFVGAIGIPAHR
jgi:predicted O-methyltransferase YrrM